VPEPDFTADESEFYSELLGELQDENEALKAELKAERDGNSIDKMRAKMMEPYANRVFWFVVWYCIAIAILLVGSGNKGDNFELSDTVLCVIAGSTAVSVIGLIGIVLGGLFGKKS